MKMLHSTLDIVWKGLVLQTRTWKWTAVIVFAISCISNSSSNSNNSSNNVIIATNNSSGINNSVSQRKKDRHLSKVDQWWKSDRLIKCCEANHWRNKRKENKLPLLSEKREARIVSSQCSLRCTTSQIKLVFFFIIYLIVYCLIFTKDPSLIITNKDFTCSPVLKMINIFKKYIYKHFQWPNPKDWIAWVRGWSHCNQYWGSYALNVSVCW